MENIKLTRRSFLKTVGLGALSMLLPSPVSDASAALIDLDPPLARILRYKLLIHEEPNARSKNSGFFKYDDIISLPKLIYVENIFKKKVGWYQISDTEYIEAAWVQPVFNRLNPVPRDPLPEGGTLGEITVPKVPVYLKPKVRNIHRTFYYENNFWVLKLEHDEYGLPWYELWDDLNGLSYYVPARTVHLTKPEELLRSIRICARCQAHRTGPLQAGNPCFEYDRLVFKTLCSTGIRDGLTPVGRWMTHRKRPCRRMVNEPANPNVYDLPGVPWVSYITIFGVAFHGAFWHSNWGNVMSNGCINMKAEDAKWIYRWTTPGAV
jgi:hypothetical protein